MPYDRGVFSMDCLLAGVLGAAVPVLAQDQTLADIRQELSVLSVEVQRLKRELSTTGGGRRERGWRHVCSGST